MTDVRSVQCVECKRHASSIRVVSESALHTYLESVDWDFYFIAVLLLGSRTSYYTHTHIYLLAEIFIISSWQAFSGMGHRAHQKFGI